MTKHLTVLAVAVFTLLLVGSAQAQLLRIGAADGSVDSTLSKWKIVPSDNNSSDSVCLGAKCWDLDGHLLFHIDSVEHTLTKVDWSAYMPISRPEAEDIAQKIAKNLGQQCDRARNHDWVYWIWDNDDLHYLLAYGNGTIRMLEFQDQGSLDACMFNH